MDITYRLRRSPLGLMDQTDEINITNSSLPLPALIRDMNQISTPFNAISFKAFLILSKKKKKVFKKKLNSRSQTTHFTWNVCHCRNVTGMQLTCSFHVLKCTILHEVACTAILLPCIMYLTCTYCTQLPCTYMHFTCLYHMSLGTYVHVPFVYIPCLPWCSIWPLCVGKNPKSKHYLAEKGILTFGM